MLNTYKKLDNGSFGAWVDTGYGAKSVAKPTVGEIITITTKAGELHTRTVSRIVREYASGAVVALTKDAEIADIANKRYQEKSNKAGGAAASVSDVCHLCHTVCYGDCTASNED